MNPMPRLRFPNSACLRAMVGTGLLLAWTLATGCGEREKAPDTPPATNATPAAAVPAPSPNASPALASLNALTNTFAAAPAQTRQRVYEAVETLQTGDARQAVTQLKTIDADSELTVEQQQSIREVIRAHRDRLQ